MPAFRIRPDDVVALVGHIEELALVLQQNLDGIGERWVIGNRTAGFRIERAACSHGKGQNLAGRTCWEEGGGERQSMVRGSLSRT